MLTKKTFFLSSLFLKLNCSLFKSYYFVMIILFFCAKIMLIFFMFFSQKERCYVLNVMTIKVVLRYREIGHLELEFMTLQYQSVDKSQI